MPSVPNLAALDCWGAPAKTSFLQVISKSVNPLATTVAWSSSSRRAPAIQPVQRSILRFAPSETAFRTAMSAI
jgi:hypothetical protein